MAAPLRDILNDPVKRESLERRFWQKIKVKGPKACWPWVARSRHPGGYGCINAGRGNLYHSHVVAYALTNGPVPAGMFVLHSCDNAGCCNPRHLRVGTRADNAADAKARKRLVGKTGPIDPARCAKKLNFDLAQEIRASGASRRELAAAYGVSTATIANIQSGRTYQTR